MSDPVPDGPAQPPAPDAAANLEHIVDDTEERGAIRDWIFEQLAHGRDPDQLLPEVIELGWSGEDAEELVEEGRRKTRHLRGVVTREDVARAAEARYRRSMAIAPRMATWGILGVGFHFLGTLLGYIRAGKPKSSRPRSPGDEK